MTYRINGMNVVIVEGPRKVEIPWIHRVLSWPWRPWVKYYDVSAHHLYDTLKGGTCVSNCGTMFMTRETYNSIGTELGGR